MYGLIEELTPDFYFTTIEGQQNWREKTIRVTRTTKDENLVIKKDLEAKKRKELDSVLGFSKIWSVLSTYKKPVIGHNCYLDLLFVFEHFHKNNPFTLSKFKETVNNCWPKIYDTKVISAEFGREDIGTKLSLEELYVKLLEITQIKVMVEKGFTDYANPKNEDKDSFHSAGFDAYTTGACFYMMSKLEKGDAVLENHINRVRMGSNKLYMLDFANPDKDICISDVEALVI